MAAERLEVLVVELALQRAEERGKPLGAELAAMVVGDLAQFPEPDYQHLELIDRSGEDGGGGRRCPESPHAASVLQRADSDAVHLADDVRLGDAVGQDLLAVADGAEVSEAGQQHAPGDVEQERVPGCHCGQHRVQLEVPDQVIAAAAQARP